MLPKPKSFFGIQYSVLLCRLHLWPGILLNIWIWLINPSALTSPSQTKFSGSTWSHHALINILTTDGLISKNLEKNKCFMWWSFTSGRQSLCFWWECHSYTSTIMCANRWQKDSELAFLETRKSKLSNKTKKTSDLTFIG